MAIQQAQIPASFNNRWRVAGTKDEYEHAQKECKVLGFERDEQGKDMVRVSFIAGNDPSGPAEALIHPHMLFPVRSAQS